MGSGVDELDERGARCFRPFVPTPPRLEHVVDLLDAALDSVRQFDRRLEQWPDPRVIGRLFARLDAVNSSGAEGSTTTFTDLLEYESSLKTAPDVEDAASVAALSDATSETTDGDLLGTVLRLHRRLFDKSNDARKAASAGRFKDATNRTADADAPGRLFAYTRPASLPAVLSEWRDFVLANSPEIPDLVRQCLAHWMFEHIHPLLDGNGRVGRLLIPIVLRDKGLTHSACVFVSEAAYEDKQLYIEALKQARISNDMLGWTRLMLGFVDRTARANLRRLDHLLQLRGQWENALARFRSDSLVHRLAPFALTRPAFTITDAVGEVGGTFASVNAAAAMLVKLGILSIPEGRRRDRLFQAPAVLDAFDQFRARQRDEEVDDGKQTHESA